MTTINRPIRVLAVDFDGTIVENKWPEIGALIPKAREVINKFVVQGGKVIIWSCREGLSKEEAIYFLMENGVYFHAFNENLPERIHAYGNDCRKVGADLYVDDLNPDGPNWDRVEEILFGVVTK